VEDCAARVEEVYRHPDLVAEKTAIAKARLEDISWDKQAAAYLDLLTRLNEPQNALEVEKA